MAEPYITKRTIKRANLDAIGYCLKTYLPQFDSSKKANEACLRGIREFNEVFI